MDSINTLVTLLIISPSFEKKIPLQQKTADETGERFVERFLSVFGLPQIIHCDIGKEIVNEVMDIVAVLWPGETSFIHGNPGHSQSQGLV